MGQRQNKGVSKINQQTADQQIVSQVLKQIYVNYQNKEEIQRKNETSKLENYHYKKYDSQLFASGYQTQDLQEIEKELQRNRHELIELETLLDLKKSFVIELEILMEKKLRLLNYSLIDQEKTLFHQKKHIDFLQSQQKQGNFFMRVQSLNIDDKQNLNNQQKFKKKQIVFDQVQIDINQKSLNDKKEIVSYFGSNLNKINQHHYKKNLKKVQISSSQQIQQLEIDQSIEQRYTQTGCHIDKILQQLSYSSVENVSSPRCANLSKKLQIIDSIKIISHQSEQQGQQKQKKNTGQQIYQNRSQENSIKQENSHSQIQSTKEVLTLNQQNVKNSQIHKQFGIDQNNTQNQAEQDKQVNFTQNNNQQNFDYKIQLDNFCLESCSVNQTSEIQQFRQQSLNLNSKTQENLFKINFENEQVYQGEISSHQYKSKISSNLNIKDVNEEKNSSLYEENNEINQNMTQNQQNLDQEDILIQKNKYKDFQLHMNDQDEVENQQQKKQYKQFNEQIKNHIDSHNQCEIQETFQQEFNFNDFNFEDSKNRFEDQPDNYNTKIIQKDLTDQNHQDQQIFEQKISFNQLQAENYLLTQHNSEINIKINETNIQNLNQNDAVNDQNLLDVQQNLIEDNQNLQKKFQNPIIIQYQNNNEKCEIKQHFQTNEEKITLICQNEQYNHQIKIENQQFIKSDKLNPLQNCQNTYQNNSNVLQDDQNQEKDVQIPFNNCQNLDRNQKNIQKDNQNIEILNYSSNANSQQSQNIQNKSYEILSQNSKATNSSNLQLNNQTNFQQNDTYQSNKSSEQNFEIIDKPENQTVQNQINFKDK